VVTFRNLFRDKPVNPLVLEEENRVGVADGGLEQAVRVSTAARLILCLRVARSSIAIS